MFTPDSEGQLNFVPNHCECITFVYACSGEEVDMPGAAVSSRCIDSRPEHQNNEGSTPARLIPLHENQYCSFRRCPEGHREAICLLYGNWNICGGIQGCTAKVFQSLDYRPFINNQLIGYGSGLFGTSGAHSQCSGTHYTGKLNPPGWPTVINTCPGQEALLSIPGLDLPEESRLCLQVSFRDKDSVLISSEIYGYSDQFSQTGEIDITQLYSTLSYGNYIMEMELLCCDGGSQGCDYNTRKYAYIEVRGSLSIFPYLSQGGGVTDCPSRVRFPSPNFPGPAFITPLEIDLSNFPPDFDILRNCPVNLTIVTISNENDIPLNIVLEEIQNCIEDGERELRFQETIIPAQNVGYTVPIVANHATADCRCYELSLSFEGCDGETVEQIRYFQVGDDCDNGLQDPNDKLHLKDNTSNNTSINVFPNPVGDYLNIEIQKIIPELSDDFTFEIFDVNGKKVLSSTLPADIGSHQIFLDIPSGVFLYRIVSNDFEHVDRFVKQ